MSDERLLECSACKNAAVIRVEAEADSGEIESVVYCSRCRFLCELAVAMEDAEAYDRLLDRLESYELPEEIDLANEIVYSISSTPTFRFRKKRPRKFNDLAYEVDEEPF
ncbi:MAG: hypothetical protein F4X48_05450 [Acidimicrobiia bacterium]|nr:hypothetical protein [Acidimicrobiia bacterium]MYC58007.1 hypothetical protein [Acidimicrobiia bacterium]MYI31044.1 hypothetical protein [Acidimicrobiia bacterium]